MSLSTGDIIDGKYRIVRLLGEGGMGAVYEGENTRIHRRVAIKVLHSGVAENADAVQRFEREAQAAGRIGSQHIVEVLDLGDLPDGDRYMVMEFMDGDSLSDRIRKVGRLTPEQIYPIAYQLLEGLQAAHSAGIIHRDLKPDNVFVLTSHAGQTDFVKILDFGISKFSALGNESGFSMTRTGAVMGTPYYMSPEQAKGAKGMDQRADLYSVGVILYECATGQVPFNADTFNELLFKIVLEEPPPLEQLVPEIDRGFAEIIRRAMAREPAHRFQTAKEFQSAIEGWASGRVSMPMAAADLTGPRPAMASLPQAAPPPANPALAGTQGAWAGESQPKKSNTGLIVGAAIAAVVLLGGGGFAAMKLSGGDAAAAQETPPAPTQPETTTQEKPEEKATEDKPEEKPEEKATEDKPEEKPEEKVAEDKPEEKPEEKPRVAAPYVPRPAATPKPSSKPAAGNEPTKSGNRIIRPTL
ncbi:MAG: protein kinase [Polyangiaceae bacterium]|nr:protein kinase [Polyangiaceae bacterium]